MGIFCGIERKKMTVIFNSLNRFSIDEESVPIRTMDVRVTTEKIGVIEFHYHCVKVCYCRVVKM